MTEGRSLIDEKTAPFELPASEVDLSIVIVSWNTRRLLQNCLEAIFDDPAASAIEVHVVDNASADDSNEMVSQRFPEVSIIANATNRGFAQATNQGIVQSSGRYILLLNPDTVAQAGTLEAMLGFLEEHLNAGAVGPMLVDAAGTMQASASPFPNLIREISRMFHLGEILSPANYDMANWDLREVREVDVLQGACLMLRREALEQVGLLDEDYFLYSEEVDLCYRLKKAGWSIHYLPQAGVVHHGGRSSMQVPIESFLHLYRGKINYFRKNHGEAVAIAYKLILATASMARLILSPLTFLQQSEQREHNLALADRYRRLLAEIPSL